MASSPRLCSQAPLTSPQGIWTVYHPVDLALGLCLRLGSPNDMDPCSWWADI